MRMIFGALGLLVVLGFVSWLNRSAVEAVSTPVSVPMPDGTTQAMHPKQIEQQYKKALEEAMNASRSRMPDE
ncbi:hypothetical protein [Hydrogenophaga sp. PAMC20947]|uniref:hypothetical protein n=1 Tax=Hydrogenophaga sp. PAMC20947 TaxID=2565558 RepID=UPI00109E25D0|nr:hypothetical protein [Hydrogenophaga sp. PAMC20947]QCB45535.1 hypothetical protein E5678_05555 [Hydrogenophaga sp. PAMC20947]